MPVPNLDATIQAFLDRRIRLLLRAAAASRAPVVRQNFEPDDAEFQEALAASWADHNALADFGVPGEQVCAVCTYVNHASMRICEICESPLFD